MLLFGAVKVRRPGPLTLPENVVEPVGVARASRAIRGLNVNQRIRLEDNGVGDVTRRPVSLRIAPGKKPGELVGPSPVPFRLSGPVPSVYEPPAVMKSICAPDLTVTLDVSAGRPQLRCGYDPNRY